MFPNIVAYVGLTHLGLISAAAALEKGFQVLCFDPNKKLIDNLKASHYPINEPDFAEALEKNRERIFFTSSLDDLNKADLVYISPDIPTNESGVSCLDGIKSLISLVSPALSKQACLIILSQVPPGFTRSMKDLLSSSQIDLSRVYYQVETLVFGVAMQRALYPERFIVGVNDVKKPLDPHFEAFLRAFSCPLLVMNYESAEFCKICINAFLAATVSTANTLEEICQRIGAQWSDIIPALRLDKRIGEYAYLTPGLGLSGGNIERDLKTLTHLSENHGSHGQVVDSFIKNSHHRRNWPLQVFYRKILPYLSDKKITLSILGLSYKENTHSTKNSAALKLISQLKGFKIQVYDPLVKKLPLESSFVEFKSNALEAIKGSDVLFLMTPWPEFKELKQEDVFSLMKTKFIVDPYKLLKVESEVAFSQDMAYYSFC